MQSFPCPARLKFVLAAIVCCYAREKYDPEEINDFLLSLGHSEIAAYGSTADSIRQFRRSYRSSIEACLSEVLRQEWGLPSIAAERKISPAQEAAARIREAVRADSWTLDF